MEEGFLGTRGSMVFDILFLSMFFLGALLIFSIVQVRKRRRFALHRRLQLGISYYLLLAVVLFEWHLHSGDGWRGRAEESPYFGSATEPGLLFTALRIHFVFAFSTPIVWIITIVGALRNFSRDPKPTEYSARHRLWGRIAAFDLMMTAITGSVFYWMAFIAS